jgi:hypothetical protein
MSPPIELGPSFPETSARGLLDRIQFFPRLGLPRQAGSHVEQLVEVAWLLMAEGYPIIEDVEGAVQEPALMSSLKLVFAEFLADIDLRLAGIEGQKAPHGLALALEHGTSCIAVLSGTEFVQLLGLADDQPPEVERDRLMRLWNRILADFPIRLTDPLQPENQGTVLRTLRTWSKLCSASGVDQGFLVKMMKEV